MDYENRHVIVTGGTGALGVAVVGALLEANAFCHVPYRNEDEARRFAHRDHERVALARVSDLAEEAEVIDFYGSVGNLWASIHLAGGFAFAPIADSNQRLLMTQLESNLISTYL